MVVDIFVVAGAIAIAAFLAWFFFGSRTASATTQGGGVQEVTVVVQGGYSPAVIQARKGVPLRIHFDRREGSDCTSRVIFPDFNVSKSLPAMATATVELLPDRVGEFDFSCQMGMVHGKLIVTDNGAALEETPV